MNLPLLPFLTKETHISTPRLSEEQVRAVLARFSVRGRAIKNSANSAEKAFPGILDQLKPVSAIVMAPGFVAPPEERPLAQAETASLAPSDITPPAMNPDEARKAVAHAYGGYSHPDINGQLPSAA